ncbi:hypothetical protein DFH28DRAFT_884374 [Melampsora americana]|nr:hypothetical protein DFH28DRAFT_884374 [Melampsora americana]
MTYRASTNLKLTVSRIRSSNHNPTSFSFHEVSLLRSSHIRQFANQSTDIPPVPSYVRSSTLLQQFHLTWLDQYIKHSSSSSVITPIDKLVEQARRNDRSQLDPCSLKYEPYPTSDRKVDITRSAISPFWDREDELRKTIEQVERNESPRVVDQNLDKPDGDGIVSITYIISNNSSHLRTTVNQRMAPDFNQTITCSGFAIQADDSADVLIVTCAHTLWQISDRLSAIGIGNSEGGKHAISAGLVMSSSGGIYVIDEVISALIDSDILILRLRQVQLEEGPIAKLRTLPISPYPCPEQASVWMYQAFQDSRLGRPRWEPTQVIEYKDVMGIAAQPGTYDDLATFSFEAIPVAGSSGGPVIDEQGAVVGLVRGHQASYGERTSRGFATVSEKIWEVFRLPGLLTRS